MNALYRAMKEIIENPALADSLSKEAVRVREELSVERIVDRWESMIG